MQSKTEMQQGWEFATGIIGAEIAARMGQEYVSAVEKAIKQLEENINNHQYLFFGAGGALGFDTLAAQTVLELKKKYPDIRLILVLPCLSQTRNWKAANISEYERIKQKADKVVYTSKEYTRDCMFKRNCHLVDNSSLCICYLKEQSGGTAYTVKYATAHGLNVHNIAL